jgi:hypothetical protein
MSNEISFRCCIEADKTDIQQVKHDFKSLSDEISRIWSAAWDAAGQETIQTFADVFKAMDQGAADAFKTAKTTATSNLGGVLYESLSGDLDQARDLLGNFGTDMGKAFEGFGEKMAKNLTKELADGLANVAQELTLNPVLDLLGLNLGSGGKGGNAVSTLAGAGVKATGLLNGNGPGLISQLLLGGGKGASGGFFDALSSGASFSEALDFAGITGQLSPSAN